MDLSFSGSFCSSLAYAVDPTVQRREGLRSNVEKLAQVRLNVFDKNNNLYGMIFVRDLLSRFAKFVPVQTTATLHK